MPFKDMSYEEGEKAGPAWLRQLADMIEAGEGRFIDLTLGVGDDRVIIGPRRGNLSNEVTVRIAVSVPQEAIAELRIKA